MRGKALSRGLLPCGRPTQTHDKVKYPTSRHGSYRRCAVLLGICASAIVALCSFSSRRVNCSTRGIHGDEENPHSIHRPPHHQPPKLPSPSSDLSEDADARQPKDRTAALHGEPLPFTAQTHPHPTASAPSVRSMAPRTSSPRRRIIAVAGPWFCKGDWMGEQHLQGTRASQFSVFFLALGEQPSDRQRTLVYGASLFVCLLMPSPVVRRSPASSRTPFI
jgi:hypothetical protein